MSKGLLFISLLMAIVLSDIAFAQTRALSGRISLDIGPSEVDREIVISVRNHSFLVVPPTFAIIRPVQSTESTTITLAKGSSSANYEINNIISDPVDYSIAIQCISCSDDFPIQYYSPTGNKLILIGSSYISPKNLPDVLNISATTRASISGNITLDRIADRALRFRATVFSIQNPNINYKVLSQITLAPGTNNVAYSITGINRAIGSDQFGVQLQCINCAGVSRKSHIFNAALSPSENHSLINFSVSDQTVPTIAPIIKLLLE